MHPKNRRVTSYDHCGSIMGRPRPDFDLLQVFLWPGEGRSQPGAMGRHVVSAIQ